MIERDLQEIESLIKDQEAIHLENIANQTLDPQADDLTDFCNKKVTKHAIIKA